jgi:hypothetical protein
MPAAIGFHYLHRVVTGKVLMDHDRIAGCDR